MKTASIMAIFLINVFMSKKWPGVGPGIRRHPALGGGPDRRHLGVGGRPPSLGDGMLITGGYGTCRLSFTTTPFAGAFFAMKRPASNLGHWALSRRQSP